MIQVCTLERCGKIWAVNSCEDNEYSQAAVSRCNEALALFGADEASEAMAILEDVSKRDPNIAEAGQWEQAKRFDQFKSIY